MLRRASGVACQKILHSSNFFALAIYKMFKRVNSTVVLLLALLALASGQLIGIDLGTEYTKVAMIHAGAGKAFTIVENMKSERKIETAVILLFYVGILPQFGEVLRKRGCRQAVADDEELVPLHQTVLGAAEQPNWLGLAFQEPAA